MQRYLIEFGTEEGKLLFKSFLTRLDYMDISDVPGMPGHPEHGMILHLTAKQAREVEKKLKMSIFDPYTFTCNRI